MSLDAFSNLRNLVINLVAKFRENTSISFLHICPIPQKELMAVLARIGDINVWEQRRCSVCGEISHWRRDAPGEPFMRWKMLPESYLPVGHCGGMPVKADLSEHDLRTSG